MPPVAETTIEPVEFPLQSTFTLVDNEIDNEFDGSVIVTFKDLIHPFLSLTLNTYVPAESDLNVADVE